EERKRKMLSGGHFCLPRLFAASYFLIVARRLSSHSSSSLPPLLPPLLPLLPLPPLPLAFAFHCPLRGATSMGTEGRQTSTRAGWQSGMSIKDQGRAIPNTQVHRSLFAKAQTEYQGSSTTSQGLLFSSSLPLLGTATIPPSKIEHV